MLQVHQPTMNSPKVTFVVPCYKLAHLLSECVQSILAQTYSDFEVLIMDDCSPDNTPEVAASFDDPRVRHVRNEHNLGHLRNYNKGIQLSRGEYVWLISADDYLRRPYILERYMQVMERDSQIGYSFCSGVGVLDNRETKVIEYSVLGPVDRVIDGTLFLENLVNQNAVLAASVLVRRECYERVSLFPLDAVWAGRQVEMGWVGDWYLWCMFALWFKVAYFAEPMVCYREHDLNMTAIITDRETVQSCAAADVAVPWMIRQHAESRGLRTLSDKCVAAVASEYSRQAFSKEYRSCEMSLTVDRFEDSLCQSTESEAERNWIRARFFDGLGDRFWSLGELRSASKCFVSALQKDPRMVKVYGKLPLLLLGGLGYSLRRLPRRVRLLAKSISQPKDLLALPLRQKFPESAN